MNERRIVIAATLATAVTRLYAVARSFWDWDEALFILGLRHYDVAAHHPHPPGFPLFIATAKLFLPLGMSEFHALQTVNVIASIAIVPVAYFLARELDFPVMTSIVAALLLAFFPNVWIFGGSAFSDVPAMVMVMAAAALLLRGRRSDASYIAGAVMTAVAVGYRPQNLAAAAVPFVLASIAQARRSIARVVVASLLCAAIIAASYGTAAMLTGGWQRYRAAVSEHEQFIMRTDSFHASGRPPMLYVIADFLVRPYRAPLLNAIVTILAAVGGMIAIVRPRAGRWIAIAMFAPVAILSVLYLNWLSASRFAIGYAPLVALLAADAIATAGRRMEPAVAALVVAIMMITTFPALRELRLNDSPPVAAATFVRWQRPSAVYVDSRLAAHADVMFPDIERKVVDINAITPHSTGLLYAEDVNCAKSAHNFTRRRLPLAALVRPRYFEATVVPIRDIATIHRSTLELPPLPGDGQLTLRFEAQGDVAVRFNGRVLEQLHANGMTVRSYRVLSRSKAMNEVAIEPDATIESFGWIPAF